MVFNLDKAKIALTPLNPRVDRTVLDMDPVMTVAATAAKIQDKYTKVMTLPPLIMVSLHTTEAKINSRIKPPILDMKADLIRLQVEPDVYLSI